MDQATLLRVGNFDQATANQLASDTGSLVEAVSAAGALSLNTYLTELTVSGTLAFTLAAPTFAGQKKLIRCVSAASTPLGTVTISAPETLAGLVLPSTVTFTAVGQEIELEASSALKWRCRRAKRAGVQILVVGTTATAGLVLAHNYSMSVTGTVSSTGANALQNGLYPGDACIITCSTAASIPSGAIDFVGITLANAAVTHIQTITGTAVTTTLNWNGVAWLPTATTTLTFA